VKMGEEGRESVELHDTEAIFERNVAFARCDTRDAENQPSSITGGDSRQRPDALDAENSLTTALKLTVLYLYKDNSLLIILICKLLISFINLHLSHATGLYYLSYYFV
jgi:hypothetical protein